MSKESTQSKDSTFWKDHLNAWKKSGLNQTEYCKRHQLSRSCFYQWKGKLKPNRLIPVKLKPDNTVLSHSNNNDLLEITLANGLSCRFPVHSNPESILPWLSYLKGLA